MMPGAVMVMTIKIIIIFIPLLSTGIKSAALKTAQIPVPVSGVRHQCLGFAAGTIVWYYYQ